MTNSILIILLISILLCGILDNAGANPQLATVEGARVNMEEQTPFTAKGKSMPHGHEVTVYLPASYGSLKDKKYPVLWVLDAPLMLRTVVGIQDTLVLGNMAPEMIIVGVGSRSQDGLGGVGRRVIDFSPPDTDYYPSGIRGDAWRSIVPTFEFPHKSDEFLSFLVDELRPLLRDKYRVSGENALFGHSAGGMFASYSLFARPGAFDKYIIGSPYVKGVGNAVFDLEQKYSEQNDDLDAEVFIAAGSSEADEYFLAASGILSGTIDFSETLRLRQYPSLTLKTQVYTNENHYTVVPRAVSDGIRFLWRNEASELSSSWPQPPE
ncbi:MAG: alpha/beta hydrolase-fold protein [Pseudomonadota bacterium]